MSHQEHKHHAPKSVNVALVTVSTSRDADQDRSGPTMRALLEACQHRIVQQRVVKDGIEPIQQCLTDLAQHDSLQAILLSGGSGISRSDLTPEAIEPYVTSWIPGFGELFRRLSFDEIGTPAMLSRACAAVCVLPNTTKRTLVVVLPGSPKAVTLAIEKVLLPELGHLLYEIER